MPYTSKIIYVTLDYRECMAFFIVCICMLTVSSVYNRTVGNRDILVLLSILWRQQMPSPQGIFMYTKYDRDVI